MCMCSQCSCLLWRGSVGIHSSGWQTGKSISISQQGSTKPQTPSSLSGVSGIYISKNLRWKWVVLPRGLHFWTTIIHMGHFIYRKYVFNVPHLLFSLAEWSDYSGRKQNLHLTLLKRHTLVIPLQERVRQEDWEIQAATCVPPGYLSLHDESLCPKK